MTSTTAATATDQLVFLGSRVRILADGSETEGAFGLVDMIEIPAGDMPPLHVHTQADEAFYLISGELTLFQPGRQVTLAPGDFFLAKRGIPHTYRVGEVPAHVLVAGTPAGFEEFVRGVSALEEVDPATLTAAAADHDIEILGPPGTLPA